MKKPSGKSTIEATETPRGMDHDKLLARCGGRPEMAEAILGAFFESLDEYRDALCCNTLRDLRRTAHGLKGAARQVGAEELGFAAEVLELLILNKVSVRDILAFRDEVIECINGLAIDPN